MEPDISRVNKSGQLDVLTTAYGPEVYKRLQGQGKRKSSTWHMDETFVRIAGGWMCLFRAVDAHGQTVDFYLSEHETEPQPKCSCSTRWPTRTTNLHAYSPETVCGAMRRRFTSFRTRAMWLGHVVSGRAVTVITGSNPITAISNDGSARCGAHVRQLRRGRQSRESRRHK